MVDDGVLVVEQGRSLLGAQRAIGGDDLVCGCGAREVADLELARKPRGGAELPHAGRVHGGGEIGGGVVGGREGASTAKRHNDANGVYDVAKEV